MDILGFLHRVTSDAAFRDELEQRPICLNAQKAFRFPIVIFCGGSVPKGKHSLHYSWKGSSGKLTDLSIYGQFLIQTIRYHLAMPLIPMNSSLALSAVTFTLKDSNDNDVYFWDVNVYSSATCNRRHHHERGDISLLVMRDGLFATAVPIANEKPVMVNASLLKRVLPPMLECSQHVESMESVGPVMKKSKVCPLMPIAIRGRPFMAFV